MGNLIKFPRRFSFTFWMICRIDTYEKNFSVYRVLILIFRCVLNPEEGEEDENFQAAKRFARQQFNRINKMVINGGVE